jgi:hypothetical protein
VSELTRPPAPGAGGIVDALGYHLWTECGQTRFFRVPGDCRPRAIDMVEAPLYRPSSPKLPAASIAGTEPGGSSEQSGVERSGKLGRTVGTGSVRRVGPEGAGILSRAEPTFGGDPPSGGIRERSRRPVVGPLQSGDARPAVAWDIDLERPEWPEGQRSNNRCARIVGEGPGPGTGYRAAPYGRSGLSFSPASEYVSAGRAAP